MIGNEQQKSELPDFVGIKKYFDTRLSSGQRKDLKKANSPDDLTLIPAYYQLIKNFIPTGKWSRERWRQVVYLMPYASHSEKTPNLGVLLARAGVREARLFQIIRSEYPNDFIQLRRILQQIKPSVNWQHFGKQLFFWLDGQEMHKQGWAKRQILEDYYLSKK
ncbi:MAG TPA: type I-E CRISPR-associated protein Cse2/CasB [Nitrospiraceae bacterium]|nr:type I-E CRISPR-associated protein Cse2/CasB [Nitrospiraceae bacterium]